MPDAAHLVAFALVALGMVPAGLALRGAERPIR